MFPVLFWNPHLAFLSFLVIFSSSYLSPVPRYLSCPWLFSPVFPLQQCISSPGLSLWGRVHFSAWCSGQVCGLAFVHAPLSLPGRFLFLVNPGRAFWVQSRFLFLVVFVLSLNKPSSFIQGGSVATRPRCRFLICFKCDVKYKQTNKRNG